MKPASASSALVVAALLCLSGIAAAQPAGPRMLIIPASDLQPVDPPGGGELRRGIISMWSLPLPADLFEEPPGDEPPVISIPIGRGEYLELVETRRVERGDRTYVFGEVQSHPPAEFMVIREAGALRRARITLPDKVVTFTGPRPDDDDLVFRVVVWKPSLLPAEDQRPGSALPVPPGPDDSALSTAVATGALSTNMIDVNLMVVYTPAAAYHSELINEEPITDSIDFQVDEASIRTEEQSNIRLNLVHVQEVEYEEQAGMHIDLQRLECPCDIYQDGVGDNHLNQVFAPWKKYQADIVSLWIHSDDESGYANIMGQVSTDFAPRAVHVVSWEGATVRWSFDHELGHNFGARHDWSNDWTHNEPYAYNHGYVNTDLLQVTIMAYSSTCWSFGEDCYRTAIWSDPTYDTPGAWGVPEGNSWAADNAKALRMSAPTVASFDSQHNLVGCCRRTGGIFSRRYRPGPCQ